VPTPTDIQVKPPHVYFRGFFPSSARLKTGGSYKLVASQLSKPFQVQKWEHKNELWELQTLI
jgi:hypothetical protein